MEFLIKKNLYPTRVTGSDVSMSVRAMKEMLKAFQVCVYDNSYSHEWCAKIVNLVERVDRIIVAMPSPVAESHLRHMEEQAKK